MCVEAMERREKRGKETSGRDEERVESTRKKRTKKKTHPKQAPHTTHKRMKIFFLKSDPGGWTKTRMNGGKAPQFAIETQFALLSRFYPLAITDIYLCRTVIDRPLSTSPRDPHWNCPISIVFVADAGCDLSEILHSEFHFSNFQLLLTFLHIL